MSLLASSILCHPCNRLKIARQESSASLHTPHTSCIHFWCFNSPLLMWRLQTPKHPTNRASNLQLRVFQTSTCGVLGLHHWGFQNSTYGVSGLHLWGFQNSTCGFSNLHLWMQLLYHHIGLQSLRDSFIDKEHYNAEHWTNNNCNSVYLKQIRPTHQHLAMWKRKFAASIHQISQTINLST